MDKGQLPLIAELDLGDTELTASKTNCKFTGTDNPRHLRALAALLVRSLPREHLDRVAGCSNGPNLISELRDLGLGKDGLPCTRVPGTDRDGFVVYPGVYSLSEAGRRAVNVWLRLRNAKVKA